MNKKTEKVVYHWINPAALFSILLAGLLLGAIAHEIVHVALISKAVTISWHIGDPQILLSVCCLAPGEDSFEWLAFLVQFAVLVTWVFLNKDAWLEKVKIEV